MAVQAVVKVVSGQFGDAEYAELSRVLTWVRSGQKLTAGRSGKADFVVANDGRMSGCHFEISCTDDVCLLRDLGSSNGTFLNDEPITETQLENGDLIRAGETLFHVRVTGARPAEHGNRSDEKSVIIHPDPSPTLESGAVTVTPAFTELLRGKSKTADADPALVNMDQPDASSRMQVVLKIESGPFGDAEFAELSRILNWIGPGQSLKVGRHPYDADMAITDDGRMSSLHFEISCDGRTAAIRDLTSTNGTTVNGEQVNVSALSHGDVIVAGETRFGVRIIGGSEVETPTVDEVESSKTTQTGAIVVPALAESARSEVPEVNGEIPFSRSMKVVLKIKSGSFGDVSRDDLSRLLVWIQPGQSLIVGSSSIEAGMRIGNDKNVAPTHFEVSCDGRVCRVKDRNTESGTWVRGKRIAETILSDGDLIKAGDTVVQVRITGAPQLTKKQESAATVSAAALKRKKHVPPSIAPSPRIINSTPFTFAPFAGRVGFPRHSLTLIVKGTFNLKPDQPAEPADEQTFATGDQFDPADEGMLGSILYESDYAHVKPQTDLLLKGTCHPEGNQPVTQCDVLFQVGSVARTLRVFGDRHWQSSGRKYAGSDPQPFTEMPLRYENSFGGHAFAANPCGKGHAVLNEPGNDARLLPNVEDPNRLIKAPTDEPDPAGFGPLARTWSRRHGELGTYDERWLKSRWPWFPEDFQWTYHNAAHPDQRIDGYLKGDEEIVLMNLVPNHSEYRSQLPGMRVRCFLIEGDPDSAIADKEFREVEMNADTLWIDAETAQLVLVWRGVATVPSAGYPDLSQIFIAAERVDRQPASLNECRMAWENFLAEQEAKLNPQPELEKSAEAHNDEAQNGDVDEELPENELDKQAREAQEKSEADLRSMLIKAGIDPDNPPEYTEEELETAKAVLREHGVEFPEDAVDEPEEEDDRWTRERVIEHLKDNRSLAGEDLSGLDLSKIDFSSVDLSEATMSDSLLTSSQFTHANLNNAVLTRADLSGANLVLAEMAETDFVGANLDGADLSQAQAVKAGFMKCSMRNVVMNQIVANDTLFCDSNLTGAMLSNAELPGADFSNCQLHNSSFQEANLTAATLTGSQGTRINMASANLTGLRAGSGCEFPEGMFHNAIGPDSSWAGGDLTSADFSCVDMEASDFTGARLCGANLHAANMKFCRLAHVDLSEALLTQMNLFEGSLDSANLTDANLSGSNMYGAEFVNAVLENTRLKGTNLKMTKLDGAGVDA